MRQERIREERSEGVTRIFIGPSMDWWAMFVGTVGFLIGLTILVADAIQHIPPKSPPGTRPGVDLAFHLFSIAMILCFFQGFVFIALDAAYGKWEIEIADRTLRVGYQLLSYKRSKEYQLAEVTHVGMQEIRGKGVHRNIVFNYSGKTIDATPNLSKEEIQKLLGGPFRRLVIK